MSKQRGRSSDANSLFKSSAFARYFSSIAVRAFGTSLSSVALPVLVVGVLGASATEVGFVNAAQFIPYAAVGLFAGVYVDRWHRQHVLVWASIGRALSLAAIPLLWVFGHLTIGALVVLLLIFGTFSVFGFAATQSLLPQIVERRALRAANARLDQAEALGQTAGPAIGGTLVGFLGAPIAIAIDAVTYVLDAILIAGLRLRAPAAAGQAKRSLRREINEGLRALYTHRILAPLAASTHVWFVANAAAITVLALFALRTLEFSPFLYGLLFAAGGLANLVGATFAAPVGAKLGSGRTITASRALYPIGWTLLALAPVNDTEGTSVAALVLVFTGFAVQGFAGGIENANEMSFRQAVTPDLLLGRVNGTMRSVNRTMAAGGALLGGVVATLLGVRITLFILVGVFLLAFCIALCSPLRSARDDEDEPEATHPEPPSHS
ncbi:MFS transporter [Humidisolicoccus flavus]|uniref:MFS transporter n=1 Tax=Humidisolicoccus flavus TaxID=3111414 RepID=UPI0032507CB0